MQLLSKFHQQYPHDFMTLRKLHGIWIFFSMLCTFSIIIIEYLLGFYFNFKLYSYFYLLDDCCTFLADHWETDGKLTSQKYDNRCFCQPKGFVDVGRSCFGQTPCIRIGYKALWKVSIKYFCPRLLCKSSISKYSKVFCHSLR